MKRLNNEKKKVSMVPMSETEKADILGDNNPVINQLKKMLPNTSRQLQCDNMHVESNGLTGVQVEQLKITTKWLITVTECSFTGSSCDELQIQFELEIHRSV